MDRNAEICQEKKDVLYFQTSEASFIKIFISFFYLQELVQIYFLTFWQRWSEFKEATSDASVGINKNWRSTKRKKKKTARHNSLLILSARRRELHSAAKPECGELQGVGIDRVVPTRLKFIYGRTWQRSVCFQSSDMLFYESDSSICRWWKHRCSSLQLFVGLMWDFKLKQDQSSASYSRAAAEESGLFMKHREKQTNGSVSPLPVWFESILNPFHSFLFHQKTEKQLKTGMERRQN